jgi:hypothetical protein
MRRRLFLLTTAAGLAIGASVATAGPAAAYSDKSVHTYGCLNSPHPGKHLGWEHQANGERRNVGGTCEGPS